MPDGTIAWLPCRIAFRYPVPGLGQGSETNDAMREPLDKHPNLSFIHERCTHLSEDELQEAEASFWRYVEIVRHINDRIEAERGARQRFDKTRP